jgi:hypothetical protein
VAFTYRLPAHPFSIGSTKSDPAGEFGTGGKGDGGLDRFDGDAEDWRADRIANSAMICLIMLLIGSSPSPFLMAGKMWAFLGPSRGHAILDNPGCD